MRLLSVIDDWRLKRQLRRILPALVNEIEWQEIVQAATRKIKLAAPCQPAVAPNQHPKFWLVDPALDARLNAALQAESYPAEPDPPEWDMSSTPESVAREIARECGV